MHDFVRWLISFFFCDCLLVHVILYTLNSCACLLFMCMPKLRQAIIFSPLFPLGVIVHYEQKMYQVRENAGNVTLALELERDAAIPVTVSVNTLNRCGGDAATGQL